MTDDTATPATGLPCSIEPALSQHEYAVSYCETHDQPADQCQPPATGLREVLRVPILRAVAALSGYENPSTDPGGWWTAKTKPVLDAVLAALAAPDTLDVETLHGEVFNTIGGNRLTIAIEIDGDPNDSGEIWERWGHQRVEVRLRSRE